VPNRLAVHERASIHQPDEQGGGLVGLSAALGFGFD
jgi:hypothetical protein